MPIHYAFPYRYFSGFELEISKIAQGLCYATSCFASSLQVSCVFASASSAVLLSISELQLRDRRRHGVSPSEFLCHNLSLFTKPAILLFTQALFISQSLVLEVKKSPNGFVSFTIYGSSTTSEVRALQPFSLKNPISQAFQV